MIELNNIISIKHIPSKLETLHKNIFSQILEFLDIECIINLQGSSKYILSLCNHALQFKLQNLTVLNLYDLQYTRVLRPHFGNIVTIQQLFTLLPNVTHFNSFNICYFQRTSSTFFPLNRSLFKKLSKIYSCLKKNCPKLTSITLSTGYFFTEDVCKGLFPQIPASITTLDLFHAFSGDMPRQNRYNLKDVLNEIGQRCPNLELLTLNYCFSFLHKPNEVTVSDIGLKLLIKNCRNLKTLNIKKCVINNYKFRDYFCNCPDQSEFYKRDSETLSKRGLINSCNSVRELDIRTYSLNNQDMENLIAKSTYLTKITESLIPDDSQMLPDCSKHKTINIWKRNATECDIEFVFTS